MRLLDVETLRLHSFEDERKAPPYAILSHTWEDQEVTFEDVMSRNFPDNITQSRGAWKIMKCAQQAKEDGLEYIWVDTCCIQKSSSAELSEAINSMFRYYKRSAVCYAYLADVFPSSEESTINLDLEAFSESRWFTRGWTLQELIAPRRLVFFSHGWQSMGTKVELSQALVTITNIPQDTLEYGDTFAQSVSRRMSWAAKRQTTRIEDRAYCLLGIFNINMPLLYGEGEQAFQRLQEEIVRITDDQTIFAWKAEHSTFATWRGLFAHSPDEFADCADCIPVSTLSSTGSMESHSITNKGLQIKLPLSKRKGAEKWPGRADRTEFLATLRCRQTSESFSPRVTIFLKRIFGNEYVRVDADKFGDTPRKGLLDSSEPSQSPFTSDIIVRHRLDYAPWRNLHKCFRIRGMWIKNASREAIMVHVAPEPQWDDNTKRFRFPEQSMRSGELQVVTCKFEIMRHGILSHAVVDLQYDPHEEYRQICCYYKHREGKVKVEIESLVRMMDGEAFLAVGLKLMSNT